MKNFSMILLMIVSMISCSSKGDELKELQIGRAHV